MERITEDRESGLPRYYYSTVGPVPLAHLVARRTGADPGVQPRACLGLRRHSGACRRAPAAAPREIRDEETTWKARPDWSRDGRRVVYSSYLGRQWHQLWLMTADGGDPLQLTYGEFDATAPRWSPDGTPDRVRVQRGPAEHLAPDRRRCPAAIAAA